VVVLVVTAVAFFMARSVGETFDGEPWLFLVPYLLIRGVGMSLYGWVGGDDDRQMARSTGLFALASLPGVLALAAGAFLPPGPRTVLWAAAIALDLAAGVAVRGATWRVHVSHFAERHGLFVIIALGESLIAIGVASTALTATVSSFVVKGVGVGVVCALWWLYFGWFQTWLEERVEAANSIDLIRNAYSFVHYLVVMGVVGVAAALESSIAHPDEPFTTAAAVSLTVGTVAYVGGVALLAWMAGRIVLRVRLVLVALVVAASLAAAATAVRASLVIGITAVALALIGILEYRNPRDRDPE
jgi:low temperature requirement protein LtrA